MREPELRADAVRTVAAAAQERGLRVRGVVTSPLPGPAGNVEYLLWLSSTVDTQEPGTVLTGEALDAEIVRQVSTSPAQGTARR